MTAANNSYIVLTEGLAPAPIATELLKQLPDYAPHLLAYLDRCQSEKHTIELNQAKCTAFEYWQLLQAGITPSLAKHNAALALLLASKQQKLTPPDAQAPFWLVELVHISPARDGAALLNSDELAIREDENQALLHSAQSLCEGTPFRLSPWSDTHWQLQIDTNHSLPAIFASSELVSRTTVNDWWDQNEASRDWRRFVNEIQMLYFDHPINQARQQNGQPPINSLWPVGGVKPADYSQMDAGFFQKTQVITTLTEPYLKQDWGQWLLNLQEIDTQLAPLLSDNKDTDSQQTPHIILCNTSEYLHACLSTPRFWQRFIPFRFNTTPSWRNQWLAQS